MNKMKGEYTKSSVKCLEIAKKFLTLANLSFTFNKVSETRHLCARADSGIQGVESGSSPYLVMMIRCLSESASRMAVWIPLSYFLHYRVLPEPYSRKM